MIEGYNKEKLSQLYQGYIEALDNLIVAGDKSINDLDENLVDFYNNYKKTDIISKQLFELIVASKENNINITILTFVNIVEGYKVSIPLFKKFFENDIDIYKEFCDRLADFREYLLELMRRIQSLQFVTNQTNN